ncbi:MAG: pectin acetylesterase-family hydrolase [bacterium]
MIRFLYTLLIFPSVFSLTACQNHAPHSSDEWRQIPLAGETQCIGGKPYAFYVRETAASNKLLIYFQAGGACPAGVPCDPDKPSFFDPSVVIEGHEESYSGTFWDHDNPATMSGIFDLKEARNPFKDYNIVFVNYCSADVHLGNRDYTNITHRGYKNTQAVLAWTYQQFKQPDHLVVAGGSAGALATPFYAGLIAHHYPQTTMLVLGDSAGSYRANLKPTFSNWGVPTVMKSDSAYEQYTDNDLTFETAWHVNMQRFPQIKFAQFNTWEDKTQQQFLYLLAAKQPINYLLKENLLDLKHYNNFYSYTIEDNYHMILDRDKFYHEKAAGIYFHQWVTDLLSGKAVNHIGLE